MCHFFPVKWSSVHILRFYFLNWCYYMRDDVYTREKNQGSIVCATFLNFPRSIFKNGQVPMFELVLSHSVCSETPVDMFDLKNSFGFLLDTSELYWKLFSAKRYALCGFWCSVMFLLVLSCRIFCSCDVFCHFGFMKTEAAIESSLHQIVVINSDMCCLQIFIIVTFPINICSCFNVFLHNIYLHESQRSHLL